EVTIEALTPALRELMPEFFMRADCAATAAFDRPAQRTWAPESLLVAQIPAFRPSAQRDEVSRNGNQVCRLSRSADQGHRAAEESRAADHPRLVRLRGRE